MKKIESLESQVAFLEAATERKQMQLRQQEEIELLYEAIAKQQAEIELLYEVQAHNEKEYFKLKKGTPSLKSLLKNLNNRSGIVNGRKKYALGSWVYSYSAERIIGQIVEIKDNFCVGLNNGHHINVEKSGFILEPFTEKELSTGKRINEGLFFPDGKILKVGNTICWKKDGKIKILGKIISFEEKDSSFWCETKKGQFLATDVFKLEN